MTHTQGHDEPPTISMVALANRFRTIEKTMPDREFAFVLGAGASRSSGIKGAGEMVRDWIKTLYCEATGDGHGDGETWACAQALKITHYDPDDRAACYSELYHRMYARDPHSGYAYLEHEMRHAEPSYGYSVLARIMDGTRHKIVVTTNFDNLVADSLSIFSRTYPLVCGHESLAGFISPRVRRPLVVKVHRDLLLAPKSAPDEINSLAEAFSRALAELFRHRTPIVIGYGGNDGSLMKFLKDLPPASIPGGVYWCYWDEGPAPTREVRQFVEAQRGWLVPIPGFDELMLLLSNELEFEVPRDFLLKRAEDRAQRIVEQFEKLHERLSSGKNQPSAAAILIDSRADTTKPPTQAPDPIDQTEPEVVSTDLDAVSKAVESTIQRTPNVLFWWQWEMRAKGAKDVEERDRIYQEATETLPDSSELCNNYALFLENERKDYDKAEAYYKRALTSASPHATALSNYATFLTETRQDYDKAEKHFIQALVIDPTNIFSIVRYAIYLHQYSKNYDEAEKYYNQALDIDPKNAGALRGYATLLMEVRNDFEKAESLMRETLVVDPADAVNFAGYAIFLMDIRQDYDKAEEYYKQAIKLDSENEYSLHAYAVFLSDYRKNYEKAEHYFKQAIAANPNDMWRRANYAVLLLDTGRIDEGFAMLDRVVENAEIMAARESSPRAIAKMWFYAVCLRLPDRWRKALAQLKKWLMVEKVVVGHRSFGTLIEVVKQRGHPAADWLEPLAAVCMGKAEPATLDGWDAWREA